MGTSGSFGGSGGKDARDLRDNIAEWLDSVGDPVEGSDGSDQVTHDGEDSPAHNDQEQRPSVDLSPAIRLLLRSKSTGAGGGGLGGAPGNSGNGSSRSSGGAVRSVGRISRSAGRAGQLALAYSAGNREILREAGLDYDELQTLGDPVSVGIRILEAAFESQPSSTIDDAEERDIVAGLVEWILRHHDGQTPSPEDVVRKTIELTIAETALTEVSASVYAKQASYERRHSLEQDIRNVAAEYAAQANLSSSGATAQEMAQAIESGIRDIGVIFGVES